MRALTDPYGNPTGLVDNRFSEMYQYIKHLYEHLTEVMHVSANLEAIHAVGSHMHELLALNEFVQTLNSAQQASLAASALVDTQPEVTLDANGFVTATRVFHKIDTYANASTDELNSILSPIQLADGVQIFLQLSDPSRVVTIRHNNGNIVSPTNADVVMSGTNIVLLVWQAGTWVIVNT